MKTFTYIYSITILLIGSEISAQSSLQPVIKRSKSAYVTKIEGNVAERSVDSSINYERVERLARMHSLKRMRADIDSQIIDFFDKMEVAKSTDKFSKKEFVEKQIASSQFCGKLANQLYDHNKEAIKVLMHADNDVAVLMNEKLIELMSKSYKAIATSRLLRDEAINEKQAGARLAAMMNAEEKEFLALKYQEEILQLLYVVSDEQLLAGE